MEASDKIIQDMIDELLQKTDINGLPYDYEDYSLELRSSSSLVERILAEAAMSYQLPKPLPNNVEFLVHGQTEINGRKIPAGINTNPSEVWKLPLFENGFQRCIQRPKLRQLMYDHTVRLQRQKDGAGTLVYAVLKVPRKLLLDSCI